MAIDLIKGEQYAITGGNQQGGFLDVGGIVGKAAKEVVDIQEKERAKIDAIVAKRKGQADQANRKIASHLNKMKSGADIEGLNADQNKVIKDYLVEQKSQYVEAANMLATMQPGDPGYTDYVDVMNQVNQNITNVSNNMKTYKLNQKDLYEDFQENLLSSGDPTRLSQAEYMYKPGASFSLNKKGGLVFNIDGQEIEYANFNPPSAKATSTATALLKLTDQVYNKAFRSGQAANQYSSANLRMQIEDAIGSNPDIAKSLVMDGLLTNTPLKISEASFTDPAALKNDLVNQIMNGIMAASDAGAKDYAVKNQETNPGGKLYGNAAKEFDPTTGQYVYISKPYRGSNAPIRVESETEYFNRIKKEAGKNTSNKTNPPSSTNTNSPMGNFDGNPINFDTNEPIDPPTQSQTMKIIKEYPKGKEESDTEYDKRILFIYSQAMTNGEKDESGLYQKIK